MTHKKTSPDVADSSAVAFVESLIPLLPELIVNEPNPPTVRLLAYVRTERESGDAQANLFQANVGPILAPWPVLRRMWEEAVPNEKGRNYDLSRHESILYVARLALESIAHILGDDANDFEVQLREALNRADSPVNTAEFVRELMRGRAETRMFLERNYPPARSPLSFYGGREISGG